MSALDAEKAAMPVPQPGIAPARAYNGALSLDEVDAHEEAMQREASYGKLGKAMTGIVQNVILDESMPLPDRAKKLIEIGEAVLTRIDQQPKDDATAQAEGDKPKPPMRPAAKSFWSRMGALLGKKELDTTPFRIAKDANGAMRFVAVHTNHFEDRSKEILSLDAHRRFIKQADASGEYPELWLWHTKGTRYGKVDFLDIEDGFVIASGTIDRGKEWLAEKVAAMGDEVGMSHGFTFEEKDFVDGTYHAYKTYELSTLPRERACNVITLFTAAKEAPVDPEKRAWLEKTYGAENVSQLTTLLSGAAKVAAEHNVKFKDVADALVEDAAAPFAKAEPTGDLATVLAAISAIDSKVDGVVKEVAAMKAGANPFAKAEGDPANETPEEKAKRLAKKEFDDAVDAAVAKAISARGGYSATKDGPDAEETEEGKAAVEAAKAQLAGNAPSHLAKHMSGFTSLTGLKTS